MIAVSIKPGAAAPPNAAPTVSLTSPANGATFTAPASIVLTADAQDTDGTVAQVEFFQGGTLVATDTAAPFTFTLTNVAAGSYTFTAKATDNLGASTTSAAVSVTVNAAAQLFFIHPDHLNTPRVITNQPGQAVWRWDHAEPFGTFPANENPSGLGTFEFNLRFPGQYFDQETNTHYNYFRDYDPSIGRYIQADPAGLRAGSNLYLYVRGNPLRSIDPTGLVEWQGSLTGLSFIDVVGAAAYRFNLVSECVNGVRGVAKGWAYGGATGVGITISGSGSSLTLTDFNSTPDPNVFNGTFVYAGAGATVAAARGRLYGGVGYTAVLLLGEAFSNPGFGQIFGFEFGASFVSGSSIVTEGRVETCGCVQP